MIRRDWLLAAAALAAGPGRAQAAYPSRSVTLIVPFAPGGIADITARTVAQAMGQSLGQTFVVDNRPSAGSIVASQAVAQAAPDGHTLLLMSNGNAVSAGLFKKLPFDVIKDFAPISTLGFFELVICVARESRFKSLRELVAYGRANPGKLTLASIAVGSTQNLATELFKSRTGLDAVVVPYKGSPAVLTALRAGEVDAGFEILGPMLPQITSGALRALAVTGPRRNAALPDVPTAIEQGVTGYDVESWNGLAAPAGTPPAVIDRLQRTVQDALARPEVSQRLIELGVRPQASTPAQLRDLLAGEITRWRNVIEAAKIEPQ
jgi:tripartite-type tricarboxylate transporter receptor subunit TctC